MKRFLSILVMVMSINLTIGAEDYATVLPLVKVEWGQYAPYNQFCPDIKGGNAAAGCVAVTMAQAISAVNPSAVDIKDTTAVAHLIADCGQYARTIYGKSSTAALSNQIHALVDSLGYDPDIVIYSRAHTDADSWHDIIMNELQCGRPVMVSAQDATYGGHSFVIDGCRNDSVHVNWGWTGKQNGYYSLGNLNPDKYHFTVNQRIVTGFQVNDKKQTVHNALEADVRLSDTLLYQSQIDDMTRINMSIDIRNCAYYPFKGYYYIYFVDENGTRTKAKKGMTYILTDLACDRSTSAQVSLIPPSAVGVYQLLIRSSLLLEDTYSDMSLAGSTTLTILPGSVDGIEKTVIDVDDTNNGQYYNAAGQRIAKPTGKHLFKRTRQGGQLVI